MSILHIGEYCSCQLQWPGIYSQKPEAKSEVKLFENYTFRRKLKLG